MVILEETDWEDIEWLCIKTQPTLNVRAQRHRPNGGCVSLKID